MSFMMLLDFYQGTSSVILEWYRTTVREMHLVN